MYEEYSIDFNFQTASAQFEDRRLLMRVLNATYRIYNKFLALILRYA